MNQTCLQICHNAEDPELASVLNLVRTSFAYMDARINPPSSIHLLTLAEVRTHCQAGEVWSMAEDACQPVACIFLKPEKDALYLGRLAVADSHKGRGLSRQLVELAAQRACVLGKNYLELKSRVELTEVHAVFARLGFEKTGEGTHEGFDKPTYFVMRKALNCGARVAQP